MKNKFLKICGLIASAVVCCLPAEAQTTCHDIGGYNSSTALFEGSVDQKAPFCFAYAYSCVQQIYTAGELAEMNGKKITKLKYRVKPDDWETYDYTNTTKIYFVETSTSEFVMNEYEKFIWLPVTESNLVCTQEVSLDLQTASINEEDLEIEYTLTAPYVYRGKNLMIMFVQVGAGASSSFNDFYCFPANVVNTPFRTLYFCDHYMNFDSPFQTMSDSALKQVPVVMFTCVENDDPDPDPDLALVPVFYGLASDYLKGEDPVVLEIRGAGKELFTVFKVNGMPATQFDPAQAGKYKVEAFSSDGKAGVTAWVTVR